MHLNDIFKSVRFVQVWINSEIESSWPKSYEVLNIRCNFLRFVGVLYSDNMDCILQVTAEKNFRLVNDGRHDKAFPRFLLLVSVYLSASSPEKFIFRDYK